MWQSRGVHGTPIGYKHNWSYSDTSVDLAPVPSADPTQQRADFTFVSVKTSVEKKRKFGPGAGAAFHWLIVGRMRMELEEKGEGDAPGAGSASPAPAKSVCVSIVGPKYKLGHRPAGAKQWSYETIKAPSKERAKAKFLDHASHDALWNCHRTTATLDGVVSSVACDEPEGERTDDAEAILMPTADAVRFECRSTTWQETKAALDRWTVAVTGRWYPVLQGGHALSEAEATSLCERLAGVEWLLVAEQIAVKRNPSTYDTTMLCSAYPLGTSATPTACASNFGRILRSLAATAHRAAQAPRRKVSAVDAGPGARRFMESFFHVSPTKPLPLEVAVHVPDIPAGPAGPSTRKGKLRAQQRAAIEESGDGSKEAAAPAPKRSKHGMRRAGRDREGRARGAGAAASALPAEAPQQAGSD
jgi:hypothetical protein